MKVTQQYVFVLLFPGKMLLFPELKRKLKLPLSVLCDGWFVAIGGFNCSYSPTKGESSCGHRKYSGDSQVTGNVSNLNVSPRSVLTLKLYWKVCLWGSEGS